MQRTLCLAALIVSFCGCKDSSNGNDAGIPADLAVAQDLSVTQDMAVAQDMTVPPEIDASTPADMTASLWIVEDTTSSLNAVWGKSSPPTREIWAVGQSGKILYSTGDGTWTGQTSGVTTQLNAVHGAQSGKVYAGGAGTTVLRQDVGASTWTQVPVTATLPPSNIYAIWGYAPELSPKNTYFFGDQGRFLRAFDDPSPITVASGSIGVTVRAITAQAPTEFELLCVVGDETNVGNYSDGMGEWNWRTIGSTADTLYGLWQARIIPPTSEPLWSVGTNGKIYRAAQCYNFVPDTGSGWTEEASGVSSTLRAVWGSSSSDIYVVGDGGVILRSTGNGQWTREVSGTVQNLRSIWGASATDIFIVGDGIILHKQTS